MKNPTTLQLNEWYCEQDFDKVSKITGINPMDYQEGFEMDDDDTELSRDEAIDEARKIWNEMPKSEKVYHFKNS
jgi:hypothetical protein